MRPGYKQTEVGVIPGNWVVDSFASVTPVGARNGIVDGPFGSNLKTIHYRKSGIPIITSGYVTEGKFEADAYLYVDKEKFEEEKRSAVRPGDIVVAKIGARCGASAILPNSHQVGILSGNALKISVDQSRHSTFYIWQVLWGLYSSGRMDELRTVGAQPAVSMANLKKYKIPLPPYPEQCAIATALSDADVLLAKLDQLIAKNRDLKQATMQQLLTGHTRLPGFSGEWETKLLGDLGRFLKGRGVKKDEARSGDLPCIRYGEIYTHHNDYIHTYNSWISPEVAAAAMPLKQGDLLFAGSGETKEEIGKCVAFIEDVEAYAGGDIVILRPNNANAMFLGYYCNTPPISSQKASRGQGDAVVHISTNALSSIEMRIPGIEEQTSIATVLSDIDAEIAALEARRDKTRALKQGMMQELLTGRIRLI